MFGVVFAVCLLSQHRMSPDIIGSTASILRIKLKVAGNLQERFKVGEIGIGRHLAVTGEITLKVVHRFANIQSMLS